MLIALGAVAWWLAAGSPVARLVYLSMLVYVPLAARLLLGNRPHLGVLALVCALATTFGGPPAALSWLAATLVLALQAVLEARRGLADWLAVVPLAYTVVGSLWWAAARAEMTPLGFTEPIVSLTAAHFHHAALTPLASAVLLLRVGGSRRLAIALCLLPALVGLGIAFSPELELVAASGFVGALVALGLDQLRYARALHRRSRVASVLLGVGALFLFAGTTMAGWYALGEYVDLAAPSIATMVQTHAVLNGVGYGGATLLGWWRAIQLIEKDNA